jgi:predicted  nucleic acid-binding Zn-ribbon protein
MTPQEMNRRMEFIIEQQAKFSVNIQKLEENVQKLTEAHTKAEQRMTRMEGAFVGLVNLIGDSQRQTETRITELADAQAHTDERLNTFINVLERYIDSRNGGSHE